MKMQHEVLTRQLSKINKHFNSEEVKNFIKIVRDEFEAKIKQARSEITGQWGQTCGVSKFDYELDGNEAIDRLEEITNITKY